MYNVYKIANIISLTDEDSHDKNKLIGKEISFLYPVCIDECLMFDIKDLETNKNKSIYTTPPVISYNRERHIGSTLFIETTDVLYEFEPIVQEPVTKKEEVKTKDELFIEGINDLISVYKNSDDKSVKNVSDGYHTFDELYYHRMVLFAMLCNTYPDKAWKSWYHHDGTMFDGDMFICGINTPKGQYTYHYKSEHWHNFNVVQLFSAPVYDGHKPSDIKRLFSLLEE